MATAGVLIDEARLLATEVLCVRSVMGKAALISTLAAVTVRFEPCGTEGRPAALARAARTAACLASVKVETSPLTVKVTLTTSCP